MLATTMRVLLGAALLCGCAGRDEAAEGESSDTMDVDTAMVFKADEPGTVPIEVTYRATLLIPENQRLGMKLPETGDYRASGKGVCRIDEGAGTFQVGMTEITSGNIVSFTVTRWRPAGKPYVTTMMTAPVRDVGLSVANDGSQDFDDKADMTARRTGDGGRLDFDAVTTGKSYALKGTATCARVSPPIQ